MISKRFTIFLLYSYSTYYIGIILNKIILDFARIFSKKSKFICPL